MILLEDVPFASFFRNGSLFRGQSTLNVGVKNNDLLRHSLKGTLPETNGKFAPKNRPFASPIGKEKVFQVYPFSGAKMLLVSGRVKLFASGI